MSEPKDIRSLLVFFATSTLLSLFIGCSAVADGDAPSAILHYEVDPEALSKDETVDKIGMASLLATINERLGALGRANTLGDGSIEIHLKKGLNQTALKSAKLLISSSGDLAFRYPADSKCPNDRLIIEQALLLPLEKKELILGVIKVAEWDAIWGQDYDSDYVKDHRLVKRFTNTGSEVLILMDSVDLTGEYLTSANKGIDKRGRPSIDFSFDREWSPLSKLTSKEKIIATHRDGRFLGFLMDKKLVRCTPIRRTLSRDVQFSGFAEYESNAIIAIVNAGMLPYPLRSVQRKTQTRTVAPNNPPKRNNRESDG